MPKTLLLADDSVTIQKVVGISFANEDVSITTVDNGDDAIAKARALRPDVILADVVMPGKSGYEVCEAVKADAALRHIPVLLLTGTFEAFDEERAARAGAAGHVAKPFEAQTLVDRVKELLAQAPAAPPPSPGPAPAPPDLAAETPTNPELGAEPGAPDNAFDFFDDNAGELSEDLAPAAADAADVLDLDEPDTAFAFGEDDLGAVTQEPAPAPPLRGSEEAPDATVAILPDDAPAAAGPAADDPLDFAFDGADGPDGAASASVESEDLVHATLLDPAVGAGFDVSSSDLARDQAPSAPAAPPSAPPPSPPTRVLEAPAEPGPPAAAPAPDPQPLPRDPVMDRLAPQPPAAPRAAAPAPPAAPAAAAEAPPRAASSPAAGWEAEPPAAMPRPFGAEDGPQADPVALHDDAEASVWPEEPDDLDDAEPLELEPEPDAPAPASRPASAPSGGPAGAASTPLSPAMREELNATLEKIAWDAFGQVTEKIVAEALERIEQVAWEVIPKLAETLLQEEIRRLKDESAQ